MPTKVRKKKKTAIVNMDSASSNKKKKKTALQLFDEHVNAFITFVRPVRYMMHFGEKSKCKHCLHKNNPQGAFNLQCYNIKQQRKKVGMLGCVCMRNEIHYHSF